MTDSPPDSPGPEIRVTLPDGRGITGRLLRWRQDQTGAWWAETVLCVPAADVQQTAGEDYSAVPRGLAEPPFVLAPLRHDTPGRPALDLHTLGCWLIQGRATPATAEDARFRLRDGGVTACDACQPEP